MKIPEVKMLRANVPRTLFSTHLYITINCLSIHLFITIELEAEKRASKKERKMKRKVDENKARKGRDKIKPLTENICCH